MNAASRVSRWRSALSLYPCALLPHRARRSLGHRVRSRELAVMTRHAGVTSLRERSQNEETPPNRARLRSPFEISK